jgi:coenzyme PQQ precursor peptide PqqA
MEQVPSTEPVPAHQPPEDAAKLISKLRWIGMDDEARRLQTVVARLPQTQEAQLRQSRSALTDAAPDRRSHQCLRFNSAGLLFFRRLKRRETMAWTTPVLVEICIGLEINGYMPADGYVPPDF